MNIAQTTAAIVEINASVAVATMEELIAKKAAIVAAQEETNAALAKAMADAEKAMADAEKAVRDAAIAEIIEVVKASLEASGLSVADLRSNDSFDAMMASAITPRPRVQRTERQKEMVRALVKAGVPMSIAATTADMPTPAAIKFTDDIPDADRVVLTLGEWNTNSRGRRIAAVETLIADTVKTVLAKFAETETVAA